MTVLLSPVGGVAAQFFDNNGNPLTGGKLYSYAAGTTTPAATYTNSLGTIAHTNPIVLDAGGRVPGGEIWLTDGVIYKFVLQTSTNVLIATYDNIVGINSNFVNYTASQEIQTATANQTVFNLTTMQYQPGTNSLTVYVDGVNQYGPGAQYAYTETDSDTVTFVSGLHVGASVKFTTATQVTGNATDASVVAYTPPFTSSVATNVEAKLAQYVSVKDFGAVGDGVTNDQPAIQAALNYVFGAGGGEVFVPTGDYKINAPIIVRSNTVLRGSGAGSVIKNMQDTASPSGNVIHIGYGYEWNQNGQSFNPASNDDATLAQLLVNNFSKITTTNVKVCNLMVESTTTGSCGLGIWTLNAMDVSIENIWSTNTLTPVNIANDAGGWEAACANVSVNNIFQVTASGNGDWYDLLFAGSAVNVSVSNCFSNPNTPSNLTAMMVFNKTHKFTVTGCKFMSDAPASGKYGIEILGLSTQRNNAIVSENIFQNLAEGIIIDGVTGNLVSNNQFESCTFGLEIKAKKNLIDGNYFANMVTADIAGNADTTNNIYTNNYFQTAFFPALPNFKVLNTFTNNVYDQTIAVNFRNYPPLRAINLLVTPIEGSLSLADAAALSRKDSILQLTAPGTVSLYYKIPAEIRQISSIGVYLYSAAAGETVAASIVGQDTAINTNAYATYESLGTYTTVGTAVEESTTFTPTQETLYVNGGYYLKLTFTVANVNSQLRATNLLAYSIN
jgi:parallel beta-helix repeat protein